jgi:hypothetical protein
MVHTDQNPTDNAAAETRPQAFTPGPWRFAHGVILTDNGDGLEKVVADIREHGSVPHTRYKNRTVTVPDVEDAANGRLIAAAPELLSALSALLFNADHGNGLEALYAARENARKAIFKATGHEQC